MTADWCFCGLHWLPAYMGAHLEDSVRHTRGSCLAVNFVE